MTTDFRHGLSATRFPLYILGKPALVLMLTAWLTAACTRFLPPEIPRDMEAERMVAGLRLTNAGLTRFKCVGKVTLSGPDRPSRSFRAAMAGQLADRLRIDMFAPFGGSAGTISSDGKHLFFVMHPSGEYHKKRFGNGSLSRMIHMDVTVGDLLELLAGRIPMDDEWSARSTPDERGQRPQLVFVDRWGRTRQRITVDAALHPVESVWFDGNGNPTHTLTVAGQQVIDGFVLPTRINLSAPSGEGVSVSLDRYEANASLDENLFTLAPLPS